jgi:hypothetical protein
MRNLSRQIGEEASKKELERAKLFRIPSARSGGLKLACLYLSLRLIFPFFIISLGGGEEACCRASFFRPRQGFI